MNIYDALMQVMFVMFVMLVVSYTVMLWNKVCFKLTPQHTPIKSHESVQESNPQIYSWYKHHVKYVNPQKMP